MYIIAEAGVNHNGSEELAIQLIDVAAKAGAHAVKFQTFKAEKLVTKGTASAEYQQQQTGCDDQFEMLKQLELSEATHQRLMAHCEAVGIEFLSTPFDIESARFLVEAGMKRIKVPSGELSNIPFIKQLAEFNLPMILSTGMADISEIHEAVVAIEEVREQLGHPEPLANMLTILHCTSNYPTANENVNLRAITTMQQALPLPIGYSDHTEGIEVSVAAAALGAVVLEKHFTLDRSMPGPDHMASIEPQALTDLVAQSTRIEACLGSGIKAPNDSELPIKELVRRSLVLQNAMPAGSKISSSDLQLLRPGTGIPPKHLQKVIGMKLVADMPAGTVLQWDDLQA